MPVDDSPRAFHLMAKPTGALCNLDCQYCFFLKKADLYPGSGFRMTEEVLESYIKQTIENHQTPAVEIAWQGGEPTLMGLDFFRKAIEYERKYRKPGMQIQNTIQTNGTLLDEEWCSFFHENNFLVGISLDGPRELHDAFRTDKMGQPTFELVMDAVRLLQRHGVDFNILCTINAANETRPLEVYRFFRDEVGAEFIQFIPVVEREKGKEVSERSVRPEQLGKFLCSIFDEWVRNDVGRMFVLQFDGVLWSWLSGESSLCIFRPTCGLGLALEHNGDLYSCDHFVEPSYKLGNIMDTSLSALLSSEKQRTFGKNKRDTLPRSCLECEVLFTCHGECPKNRFLETPEGEVNYLCAGYKAFFKHVDEPMRLMADLLKRGLPAERVMSLLAEKDAVAHLS